MMTAAEPAPAAGPAESAAPCGSNSYRLAVWSMTVRIAANLLMLAAVFLAMYKASRTGTALSTFSMWFFGATVPVWFVAGRILKWLRRRFPAEDTTYVALPGRKPALVRWAVREELEEETPKL